MTALDALEVDPGTPGFSLRPDYYEVLARLRREAPVYEYAPGIKAVSRYHDIRRISRDPETFCSGRGALVNDPLREGGHIAGSILHMDPPQHGEWRRVLNREFTARAMERKGDEIRRLGRRSAGDHLRHDVAPVRPRARPRSTPNAAKGRSIARSPSLQRSMRAARRAVTRTACST